jgi:hypothetical protein
VCLALDRKFFFEARQVEEEKKILL